MQQMWLPRGSNNEVNLNINDIERALEMHEAGDKKFFKNFDFIVGVSRGGLIPAALIATKLNIPLVTAYIDKKDKVYVDRIIWLHDKKVLVIDDIIRSGKTMQKIIWHLQNETWAPKSITALSVFNVKGMKKYDLENARSMWTLKEDINMPWDY